MAAETDQPTEGDDPKDDAEFWDEFLAEHQELSKAVAGTLRPGRPRKLPTSAMTMVDGSPLRVSAADDIDVDGDPFGHIDDDTLARATERVSGMTQFGHGFKVESVALPAPPTRCKYCDGPMARTSAEWLCEFGSEWLGCSCNCCLIREQYEAGQYRAKGRPRTQCGAPECKRQADRDRQSNARTRKKPTDRKCHV
jgi:hypothetical protein